jgi:hypothetical protein
MEGAGERGSELDSSEEGHTTFDDTIGDRAEDYDTRSEHPEDNGIRDRLHCSSLMRVSIYREQIDVSTCRAGFAPTDTQQPHVDSSPFRLAGTVESPGYCFSHRTGCTAGKSMSAGSESEGAEERRMEEHELKEHGDLGS